LVPQVSGRLRFPFFFEPPHIIRFSGFFRLGSTGVRATPISFQPLLISLTLPTCFPDGTPWLIDPKPSFSMASVQKSCKSFAVLRFRTSSILPLHQTSKRASALMVVNHFLFPVFLAATQTLFFFFFFLPLSSPPFDPKWRACPFFLSGSLWFFFPSRS